uniref:Electron transfer flavoprotein subunit beta n=1 Tax=candidate division WOR-3 bacterium TaxID=2052148 RepID=A0A7C3YQI7_UNCW3
MKVIVALKRVPEFSEIELKIDEKGKDIKKDNLPWTINEADNYALEEALLIKEKFGGEITAITIGKKESEEVLRLGLAKGVDNAIRIDGDYIDPMVIGFLMAKVIRDIPFDLILCGAFSSDFGYAACGPILASFLSLPFVCYVNKIEFRNSHLEIERELEGGRIEVKKVPLPCLLTIQTGINTPRYASLLGIKRAQGREIKVFDLNALSLTEEEIKTKTSLDIHRLFKPLREAKAEFLTGTSEEIAERVARLIKEKGLL